MRNPSALCLLGSFPALLSACASPPLPPPAPVRKPVVVTPAPAATAAPAVAEPAAGGRCARLSNDAKVAAKALYQAERAKAPPGKDGYDDALFALPRIIGACFEDKDGAFVVTLQKAALQDGWPQIEAWWALTHVDAEGHEKSIVPTENEDDAQSPESYNWLTGYPGTMTAEVEGFTINDKLVVFSYVHGAYHEDREFSRGRLFAFQSGMILPYAPAAEIHIEKVADEDRDGVLDLLTYGPFDASGEWCSSGFGRRLAGPLLLAHGHKDGTFSLDDAAAIAHARQECPKPPAHIVVKRSEQDTDKSARNIACMRLWGTSPVAVEAQIKSECPPVADEDSCQPGVCGDHDTLQEWARMTPPLTIR